MTVQYACNSENKSCEGFAASPYEAKQKIRAAMHGEHIDWKNDVTIIEVKEENV